MNKRALVLIGLFLACGDVYPQTATSTKTNFQTAGSQKPETDVCADAVMIYETLDERGVTFEQYVQSWRDRGYRVEFVTGMAQGDYQDHFLGKWDGVKDHLKEGQRDHEGREIVHGHPIPYIILTESLIRYIQEKQTKRVIDAGITSIYLEEPESRMRGGYSEASKSGWQKYYGLPWRDQQEPPENTYLSNKLKYYLYYDALNEIFTYARTYGKSKGLDAKCFVSTHSLVNYTSWQIVSLEVSLASLDCVDGYIAQIWTGTACEPNYYNGVKKERVFKNVFPEHGCMESMTTPLNHKMYFLTDPIEDRAKDWLDYKINYQVTSAAQPMYPTVDMYEVMPQPDRIYQGLYRVARTDRKERAPCDYSTQMQITVNTLNDIRIPETRVSGTHDIGALMANSLIFQCLLDHDGYDDPQFSGSYGQTLPLLKRGIPVGLVHMKNTPFEETFEGLKMLVMSCSNMKPTEPRYHDFLATWVKKGGALTYCGEDANPYQSALGWRNSNGNRYKVPSEHLLEKLGLDKSSINGTYSYGRETVTVLRKDPEHFVLKSGNGQRHFDTVSAAYRKTAKKEIELKNSFLLEQGPYTIAAALNESTSDAPMEPSRLYIDLFDEDLPVLTRKVIRPGEQSYLYNVDRVLGGTKAKVLRGASWICDEKIGKRSYSFVAKGPLHTTNASRVLLPKQPRRVCVNGKKELEPGKLWEERSGTLLLRFENGPVGVQVDIEW